MRTRKNLNFDLSNERHVAALEFMENRPLKLQSEFVISCILNCNSQEQMTSAVCNTISVMLKNAVLPAERTNATQTDEVPDELLNALDNL